MLFLFVMRRCYPEISLDNIHSFEPNMLLPEGTVLDTSTRGGIFQFIKYALKAANGTINNNTARELVEELADYSEQYTPYSYLPFRYAVLPNLPDLGSTHTAEATVAAALCNMRSLTKKFGPKTFAATKGSYGNGRQRTAQWRAALDDTYELRLRGSSGAGTFSLDLGLGTHEPARPYKYNELWRTGIDTIPMGEKSIVRFIRTGSAIKPGDTTKQKAFNKFRKAHGLLPQRMLAILGLYYARELEPSHVVALTTEGAITLSTLGKSTGCCDYSGIFSNVGFMDTTDPNWSAINDFPVGFYNALDRANIRRSEADTLHAAALSLKDAKPVGPIGQPVDIPPFSIHPCSDNNIYTIENELAIYAPSCAKRQPS